MFRIHTTCGVHCLLYHFASTICVSKLRKRPMPEPYLCSFSFGLHLLVVSTTFVGSGHNPSFIALYPCFSAQAFHNVSFHHMIIIFFTSYGHVSFKFKLLLSGDTITSYVSRFISNSSSCNPTELTGPFAFLPTDCSHLMCTSTPVPSLFFTKKSQQLFVQASTRFEANTCPTSMSCVSRNRASDAGLLLPAALAIYVSIVYPEILHVLIGTTLVIATSSVPALKCVCL